MRRVESKTSTWFRHSLTNRKTLERTPIFAAAAFVAFLFLATLWNFAVERDWPKLRIRSDTPLEGVEKPNPAPWTIDAFLAGETQKVASRNLGQSLPAFPISVRAKNQLLYSLFRVSGAANIVVGENDQLFERAYIDEFCKRGAAPDLLEVDRWADKVQTVSETLKARGKRFLYLITPSKAARYPRYLPKSIACKAQEIGAGETRLPPFRAALEKRHIPHIDGAGLMTLEQPHYPIDLFPRGGTHWNHLGAALALRGVAEALEASSPGSPLGVFNFDWRLSQPRGTDRDLLDLLNLLWPDLDYPTATVSGQLKSDACPKPAKVTAFGGSFLREIVVVMAQMSCAPDISHWFYMRRDDGSYGLVRYHNVPGDVTNGEKRSADKRDISVSLADADIILMEENKSNIAHTDQLEDLFAALHAPP